MAGAEEPATSPLDSFELRPMKSSRLAWFFLAVGVGASWAAYLLGRQSAVNTSPLFVDPAELDFGNTWVTSKLERTLSVTNTSSEPVDVVDLRPSCTCTSIQPTRFRLAPGAR